VEIAFSVLLLAAQFRARLRPMCAATRGAPVAYAEVNRDAAPDVNFVTYC
jgi:hypothetical protein